MQTSLFSLNLLITSTKKSNQVSFEFRLSQDLHPQADLKSTLALATEYYAEKQSQVDNLANFILQFLYSLEDIFQELNFKDKKIADLKKTIIDQSDFTLALQDEIHQYQDKLNNAEDHIHWMQQEMQYFDLLSLSHLNPETSALLSKCKSQKTLNSEILFGEEEKSQRRKKIDYERLKFYIEALKEQKNHLIREYNNLVDEHQRKLSECEKHSVLLDELFEKFKTESDLELISKPSIRKERNSVNTDWLKKCLSQQNLTSPSENEGSNEKLDHSFEQITEGSYLRPYMDSVRHSLKQEYDESFTEGNSVLHNFTSDTYFKHNLKMNAGVNTKKVYLVSNSCQTQKFQDMDSKIKQNQHKRKQLNSKTKLSQKSTLDEFITESPDIQCEISINLKNVSGKDLKTIDFSKLINRDLLRENSHSKGYTVCHRQSKKGSKHLCQHLYCFMTNKVVTQRIKKYKYAKKQ